MSRIKLIFAGLVLTVIAGIVPEAQAHNCTTLATPCLQLNIAGSSGMWQAVAIGAYNAGAGSTTIGSVGPMMHWTSQGNKVVLNDNRPSPANTDPGGTWIVWDSTLDSNGNPAPKVWIYTKVDSVVGLRCYFANPRCIANAANADLTTTGTSKISTAIWGADTPLPASIVALLDNAVAPFGQVINAAATDIRPEDGAFAECRVNSLLGASAQGGVLSDGLDGLGYGTKAAGVCPANTDANSFKVGSSIVSAVTGVLTTGATAATANVVAFNVTGTDPFGTHPAIPAFTTYPVGVAPIVFVFERDKGQLGSLTNATEGQLQQVFSGTNCDASAFGLPAGGINIFLREPLSGTMNTTEATVFRRPTVYPNAPGVLGLSQEANVGLNNPLNAQAGTCLAGGGKRYHVVGSGEEVSSVANSGAKFGGIDAIGYTFFSYGNVSAVAHSTNYGYLRLNGIDPIFEIYAPTSTYDPGQSTLGAGVLPSTADLPVSCAGAFPCAEGVIWKNGFSFPHVRDGSYRSWSLLRLIAQAGTVGTDVNNLKTLSNKVVVTTTPDYVPAATVAGTTDLGIKLLRSHYQQKDGAGTILGSTLAPVNSLTSTERGGDMGGFIIPTTIGVTTYTTQTKLVQNATSGNADLSPVQRP